LHERVFAKLRDEFPELVDARPEMAAYHAEQAGLRQVAVQLLKKAGMRAFGRTAMAEAEKHLSHAIEMVDALPEPDRSTTEIDLQAIVGPTYMATLGWAVTEVERSCERLRDLAGLRGDGPRLYQAMWGLWTVHFLRGQLDAALDVARKVLEMATAIGDPMLRVTGHHAVGFTLERRGEYAEAIRHADEGLALFDLEQERKIVQTFLFSSTCALWWFRGQSQLALGQVRSGVESLRQAAKVIDELGHAPARAFLLSQQCWSLALDSDEQIAATARTMRSLAIAEGFALWVPYADIFLAWTAARRGGDAAEAVARIQSGLAVMGKARTHVQDIELSTLLAETLLLAGRPREVFAVMEPVLAAAREGKQGHLESEIFRLQGEAAAVLGDHDRAADFFGQAIESARSLGARLLELRATLSLARLGGAGQRARLAGLLAEFTEGLDHQDLEQASAFLATPDPSAEPNGAPVSPL
jgi:tetratricopeptide (TPR) repeat protein